MLALFLFLLPWQTRYILHYGAVNGGYFEYGTISLYGTQILLALIVAVLLWGRQRDKKWHRPDFFAAVWSLWAGALVQGILALIQFFTQNIAANKWLGMASHWAGDLGTSVVEFGGERYLRAYGSFGSPNSLGIYLAVIFVLGAVLYLRTERRILKIALVAGQSLILSGLILSFSRGGWFTAGVGLICLLFSARHLAKAKLKFLLWQLSHYFFIALFFFVILSPLFFARFNFTNRLENISVGERASQLSQFKAVFENNWLAGAGPGNYARALVYLYPKKQAWQYQPVHNIYLLWLAEYGLIGAAGILFLLAAAVTAIFKRQPFYLPVAVALFAAGMFDHWLASMWTGTAFFCLILVLPLVWTDSGQNQLDPARARV